MRKPGRRPAGSFLTILVEPDFDTKVMVPPHFSKKYKTSLSRGNVRLRIGSLGKMWFVKLEKMGGEMYALTSGWDRFFRDAALQYGDYVIFKVAGLFPKRGSTFDVSVYGVHGCECLFPGDGNKSFTVKLQQRHKPRLHIPKGMANERTGIKAKEWTKLRNGEGEEWAVRVCRGAREVDGVFLKEGWRAFWEQNNLCAGDELHFELVDTEPPTLLVVITKGTAPARGRPSRRGGHARMCNQIVPFENIC